MIIIFLFFIFVLGECTFETNQMSDTSDLMCGWTQEKVKDNFDWTVASGSTSSVQTGPSADHTLKTSLGRNKFAHKLNFQL